MITQRGSEGQAKGLFSELEGIDIDSVCNVYVADIVIFVLSIQTIIAITQMPSNE
ncbi:MAG TPA: hypothetical protein VHF08_03460 [Nitrososphaeraceae archaeon]|nr:hypothetical protein [Nitrososphaeraceae archaeon]